MELDAKTFDLGDFLAGTEQPTEVISVYFDKKIAYEITKLQKERNIAPDADKPALNAEINELIAEGEKSRLDIHLVDVLRHNKQAVLDRALKDNPVEKDFLGRIQENSARDEAITVGLWALYIDKIVASSGSTIYPVTEDDIRTLRMGPDHALIKIREAIDKLDSDSASGFETIAQEHDFLSQPSTQD